MSLRFVLLLPVLLVPMSWAQVPTDGAFLPEGIEATGDTAEVRALHAWADEHVHSHPKQAEQAARRALSLAREVDDRRGIADNLILLGNYFADTEQAEDHFLEAQEVFEEIGNERGLFRSRFNIGTAYRQRGDLNQALTLYFNALEGFERLGDVKGQVAVLNNIGNTHKEQDNLEEALTHYEQAVTLAETLDEPILLVNNINGLSSILVERGAYERAEALLRQALAISKNQGARFNTAFISNNLGFLFNKQGRYDRALPLLFTAEQLSKELQKDRLLVAVYDELGKAYLGLSQFDRALHYANESLILAREMKLPARQMEAHQTLSRIYETVGDDRQALVHHQQYAAAKDSVFTEEKAEIIAEMGIRYETEKKQRAIERLEQEKRIQALRQTLLLVGVGGLLLLLALLFNRYRLKQKANRLLEELDAAKSRFFANISHEFRTPLTVILGGLQDALAGRFGKTTGKLSEQLYAMQRNTRQLQRLIEEVLDLNRLEAGKLELNPVPDDLVRSIKGIVEADTPLAERNGIDLTFDYDVEHCPRLYDEGKLEKIVGNLLSNALKFTPKGGAVQVELRSGKETEIIVTDNGPGIPAEMQANVFERFAQVEGDGLKGGAGIGLALAKELAELHSGTITLESAPGEGSTFTVRLPLEETTLDDVQRTAPLRAAHRAAREGGGRSPAPQRWAGGVPTPEEEFEVGGDGLPDATASQAGVPPSEESREESDRTTVLVIEDNDDVRAFVRRSLEETYRVLEAADGENGLQQARSELPDLIVSDVMLPGIDGYEVAKRLKAETGTECIPVVMLTARAAEEDQTEGYGSGAEVYITKPFSPETFRAAIARLLEERMRLKRRLQKEASLAAGNKRENEHATLRARARSAILENLYDENFGVEELASALNMTRFTLYHRFKSKVGSSPSKFVQALRMERARELLSDSAGTVSEVAYAVGFNSRVGFSRAYSTHYGVSPSTHLGKEKNKNRRVR